MMLCWVNLHHFHVWRPTLALDLEQASSHTPSARIIRSKSHYNPTNPPASRHDSLLSASPALHIRIWNWTGGISCFLPLAISEKTDSLRLVCLSSPPLVNALEAQPLELRELALERWVVTHSQAVQEEGEAVSTGPWEHRFTVVLTRVLLQRKHPKVKKNVALWTVISLMRMAAWEDGTRA